MNIIYDEELIRTLPPQVMMVGVGTDVGKTLFSGFLMQKRMELFPDSPGYYWKPVQSGYPVDSDSRTLHEKFHIPSEWILPEALTLSAPLSPHKCLRLEGKSFDLQELILPAPLAAEAKTQTQTQIRMVIETAGGLYSPLNEEESNLDLIHLCKLPVVLVSRHYLGSLNHTLLTYEILKREKISISGFFFLGENHMHDEEFLMGKTKVPRLGSLQQ